MTQEHGGVRVTAWPHRQTGASACPWRPSPPLDRLAAGLPADRWQNVAYASTLNAHLPNLLAIHDGVANFWRGCSACPITSSRNPAQFGIRRFDHRCCSRPHTKCVRTVVMAIDAAVHASW